MTESIHWLGNDTLRIGAEKASSPVLSEWRKQYDLTRGYGARPHVG